MRALLGAIAGGLLASAGAVHATNYVLNLSSTPTIYEAHGRPGALGSVSFPDAELFPGDSLTVNVTFTEQLPGGVPTFLYPEFNIPQAAPADDGELHLDYPYLVPGSSTGFAITATSVALSPDVDMNYHFDLSLLSYNYIPVPEPALWALMVVGVGFLGGALRSPRAPFRQNPPPPRPLQTAARTYMRL